MAFDRNEYNKSKTYRQAAQRYRQSKKGKTSAHNYYVQHVEYYCDYEKKFRFKYKLSNSYWLSLRRARIKETSSILTIEQYAHIRRFYICRKLLTEVTGIVHHVDHIIPLVDGGLHHPSNLQILDIREHQLKTGQENLHRSIR